ncbi:unnamed protein product, partial [Closterium sp. NIES-54]
LSFFHLHPIFPPTTTTPSSPLLIFHSFFSIPSFPPTTTTPSSPFPPNPFPLHPFRGHLCLFNPTRNLKVALVLFPTAERLPAVMELASSEPGRTLLLMNPQWQPGQVVSDFGFGSKRKHAEEFLDTFLTAYSLKRNRIRSYDVTIVKCFPGDWQVYMSDDSGSGSDSSFPTYETIGTVENRPSYRDIEAMVQKKSSQGSDSGGWFGRIAKEIEFLKRSK